LNKALEKNVSKTIREWVEENKKLFWKYEVSSYYKSYTISVANLPSPSNDDIRILSHSRLLTDAQKNQLCRAIKKTCPKTEEPACSSICVKLDFEKGRVMAAVI